MRVQFLLLLVGPAFAQACFAQACFAQAPSGQAPPTCNARSLGQTACLGPRLCACRLEAGGSLTGVPQGYRWDCGILRPECGVAPAAPPPVLLLPRGK
jgi:hypothetical protein